MPAASIAPERLAKLNEIQLQRGGHKSLEEGACFLELEGYLVGEPWGDRPSCVSPVLAAFGRRFNDRLGTADRQVLKQRFQTRLIGTAGNPAADEKRIVVCMDWTIRTAVPEWMDLAGEHEHAKALRALPEFKTRGDAAAAAPLVYAARAATLGRRRLWREEIRAAVTAGVKAGKSPLDAARDGLRQVGVKTRAAAAAAADAAADAAAAAAADAAAAGKPWVETYRSVYDEIIEETRKEARAALEPTATKMRDAGFDLLERLLNIEA